MRKIIPATKWGRDVKGSPSKMNNKNIREMTIHYTGAPSVNAGKDDMAARIKQTERGHQGRTNENISTIGYNFVIDKWGRIWEARGWTYRNGANGARKGEKSSNDWSFSVQVCVGVKDNAPTPEVIDALQDLYVIACKRFKRELSVGGHRDHVATSCPGEDLYKLVKSGKIQAKYREANGSPQKAAPAPAPAPVAPTPAPAPKKVAPAPQPAETTHKVGRGDTYWEISVKYLGNGSRWREISKLNNGVALRPGMTIRIPVR